PRARAGRAPRDGARARGSSRSGVRRAPAAGSTWWRSILGALGALDAEDLLRLDGVAPELVLERLGVTEGDLVAQLLAQHHAQLLAVEVAVEVEEVGL